MTWLKRVAYLVFAAGVLTPIFGGMLDRDLDRDTHLYYNFLAAILCLLALLMLALCIRGRRTGGNGNGPVG